MNDIIKKLKNNKNIAILFESKSDIKLFIKLNNIKKYINLYDLKKYLRFINKYDKIWLYFNYNDSNKYNNLIDYYNEINNPVTIYKNYSYKLFIFNNILLKEKLKKIEKII